MKASRKVIESIAVAGLALALTITSITTNGLSADTKNSAEATELEKNGIAGVAAVINEYEVLAADQMDMAVSVQKEEVAMVAASAEDEEDAEVEVTIEEEQEKALTEEELEWQDKLMANVDDFLNVRAEADGDSKIVGKLYKGDRALIKKEGTTWTKIVSGNVKGYVKNEYCVFGQEALKYARKTCDTVAKVTVDGLRIRSEADADASVIKAVASGEELIVNKKADEVDGWVAVKVGSKTCYVSAEYVTLKLDTGKAVTIEEEAAAKAAAQAAAQKSAQTTTVSTTQGESLAASADEETLLAALIQCEAGGCGIQCMTAVGAVVVNRVQSASNPNSLYRDIYQRGQFGPASSGRLEQRLASGVSSEARQAARAALAGTDPTGGAKYFKLASSGHAGVVIGPIVFY